MKLRVVGFLFFFLWSLSISCKQASTSSGNVDSTVDLQALVDLYNATGGSDWVNNSGWLNGNPSNSWYGVEVDGEGRVVAVDLFQNGLSGNLPESIGDLGKLRYLNLKGNQLGGELPSSIGNLTSLEWLILAGNPSFEGTTTKEPPQDTDSPYHQGKSNDATNNFTGAIPSSIGNLVNLKRLELSGTSITSLPAEIGNCLALEGLYINWSFNLSQAIPSSIGNLTELRHLYMAENKLTGEIPSSMSNLVNLRFVDFGSLTDDRNRLAGLLPDFSGATELRSFSVDQNNLSGDWPTYWNNGSFTWLNTLRGIWNNFTGPLHGLDELPRMRSFDLTGNSLSGELPDSFTDISSQVIIIGLGWNNLSGELPQSGWPDFNQLRLVYLNDNNFTGAIPADLINKMGNNDLKWLYLQNNDFTSADPYSFAGLDGSSLIEVDISGNSLIYEEHIEPAVNPLSDISFHYENQSP